MRGEFIVVEGCEGSGKGTVLEHLQERIKRHPSVTACFTREPGGTPYAELLREMLKDPRKAGEEHIYTETELLLFTAARVQHVHNFIEPRLKEGVHVICDRFNLSTLAYQIAGRDEEGLYSLYRKMHDVMVNITPDTLIFLDVDPKVGIERRNAAGDTDRFDREDLEFHTRVRKGYKEYLDFGGDRVFTIDANKKQDEVQKNFFEIMSDILCVQL